MQIEFPTLSVGGLALVFASYTQGSATLLLEWCGNPKFGYLQKTADLMAAAASSNSALENHSKTHFTAPPLINVKQNTGFYLFRLFIFLSELKDGQHNTVIIIKKVWKLKYISEQ